MPPQAQPWGVGLGVGHDSSIAPVAVAHHRARTRYAGSRVWAAGVWWSFIAGRRRGGRDLCAARPSPWRWLPGLVHGSVDRPCPACWSRHRRRWAWSWWCLRACSLPSQRRLDGDFVGFRHPGVGVFPSPRPPRPTERAVAEAHPGCRGTECGRRFVWRPSQRGCPCTVLWPIQPRRPTGDQVRRCTWKRRLRGSSMSWVWVITAGRAPRNGRGGRRLGRSVEASGRLSPRIDADRGRGSASPSSVSPKQRPGGRGCPGLLSTEDGPKERVESALLLLRDSGRGGSRPTGRDVVHESRWAMRSVGLDPCVI